LPPADNLRVQSAIVAGAVAFVGTYGGFSYLAPFHGVPATAYYSNASGFSPSHLTMARSALTRLHGEALLDVRAVEDSHGDTESQRLRSLEPRVGGFRLQPEATTIKPEATTKA
jgi:hypothetical protein